MIAQQMKSKETQFAGKKINVIFCFPKKTILTRSKV